MTIMTTTFIPCGAKLPFIAMFAALSSAAQRGSLLPLLPGHCCHHLLRHHPEEDQDVRRRSCSVRYGAARLPLADRQVCPPLHVGARLVLHQEGRYHHPSCLPSLSGSPPTSACGRRVHDADRGPDRITASWPLSATRSAGSLLLWASATGRPLSPPSPAWSPRRTLSVRWVSCTTAALRLCLQQYGCPLHAGSAAMPSWRSTCCALLASRQWAPSSVR